MRPPTTTWPLLGVAVLSGILFTGSIPTVGAAQTGPILAKQAGAIRTSESAALLQLYAAEASLARAQAEQERLDARSSELARAEADATLRTEIVRRSLDASQRRIGALLRQLYIEGEPDPIAVILGATTLDEVMTGIDGLTRATAQNERLARGSGREGPAARRATGRSRSAARQARRRPRGCPCSNGTACGGRLGTARDHRQDSSPGGLDTAAARQPCRRRLTRPNSARPIITAGASSSTAAAASEPAPATTAVPGTPASAPVTGTHTLVVDAVAYHLPGRTASGLPVGVGVLAVDPTVIPLGTRVFVPGYGPAVAADVGTAIKGNIIDLWMPTTAQALAWGRRTVTITVYG